MKTSLLAVLAMIMISGEKPIMLADPTVFKHQSKYYLAGTGDGFPTYESKDLVKWKSIGRLLDTANSYGHTKYWAPQILQDGNGYALAYTADEHIAIARSSRIEGPYSQKVIGPLDNTVKQIDPFILRDPSGNNYLYYVQVANGGNKIFVRELNDKLEVKGGKPQLCIEATQPWEHDGYTNWKVTEGPSVFVYEGRYYLTYSANHFKSKNYAVGLAWSNSPSGPWTKYSGNPILSHDVLPAEGTGHGDLFWNAAGEPCYILHTHKDNEHVAPRRTAMVSLQWVTENDVPVLKYKAGSFRYLTGSN